MRPNPLWGGNSVHWLKRKNPWVMSFYTGDPDLITWPCQSVWLSNPRSFAHYWQTHLPYATAGLYNAHSLACHWRTCLPDATSLLPSAVPARFWRELCREACRDTQTSICVTSRMVTAPYSRSGEHEFESLVWRECNALTKVERSLGSDLYMYNGTNLQQWSRIIWPYVKFIFQHIFLLVQVTLIIKAVHIIIIIN